MILAIKRKGPYTLEKLHALYGAIKEIETQPGVMHGLHGFNFLAFKNKNG